MDPFEVLGVSQNASPEVIRAAYKALAKEFHPDRATGNNGKMAELNAAYEILSNEEKRAHYLNDNQNQPKTSHHNPASEMQRTIYQSREWQIAAMAFPKIAELYLQLERIHPILAERFAKNLLAAKKFELLEHQAEKARRDFLRENFGHDWRLQEIGKYLLTNRLLDDANRLKEMLAVLSDSPNNRDAILKSFEPHTSAAQASVNGYLQSRWSDTPPTPSPRSHLAFVWLAIALLLILLASRIS
ncbi:MAG: J domain-containing protein [Proteobacteria bacterium]|nr:J domain-containing protein [Pseudomonadota bacterium]